jgi:hypothetical protein
MGSALVLTAPLFKLIFIHLIQPSVSSMETPHQNNASTSTPAASLIPPALLLSLATGSVLLGLLVTRKLEQAIQDIGQMSEELFRGDRLPTLDFPLTKDSQSDNIP